MKLPPARDPTDSALRNRTSADILLNLSEGSILKTTPNLPLLSKQDQEALDDFQRRQNVIRDLTIGCMALNHTGAYISGPPGVGKTHTVINTLRENKANYRVHQRITAKPLFYELHKDPGANHVIEDCEQLLNEKAALSLLRSGLDSTRSKGRRERLVTYSISGSNPREPWMYFFGSIIFLANRPLTNERPEVRAVMSRIPCMEFSPSDDQIRAAMRHTARTGYASESGTMSPHECIEVVEFVINMASELKARLDLRWVEHGYGHYMTEVMNGGCTDWRDSTKFHMMNTLTYFDHDAAAGVGRHSADVAAKEDLIEEEIAIALDIEQIPELDKEARLQLWAERTRRSPATFYRRLQAGATSQRG